VMWLLGRVLLFFLNAASFVVAFVSLVFLRVPRSRPVRPAGGGIRALYDEWLEGFRIFAARPLLRTLVFAALFVNFAGQGLGVLAAAWVREALHGGALDYALFGAAITVGAIAGALWTGSVLRRIALERLLPLGTIAIGLVVVLLSRIPLLAVTLVCMLVAGVAMGLMNTALTTMMQRIVPQEKMGRVFGTLVALLTMANPLGAAVAGLLAEVWTVAIIYLVLGCLILLGSLPLLRLGGASTQAADGVGPTAG